MLLRLSSFFLSLPLLLLLLLLLLLFLPLAPLAALVEHGPEALELRREEVPVVREQEHGCPRKRERRRALLRAQQEVRHVLRR